MKVSHLILIALGTGVLSSCISTYAPTTITPTALEEKGDASIEVSQCFDGARINVAYSPINHMYVQGSGQGFVMGNNLFNRIVGLGAGYYRKLGSKLLLEAGGGMEWGHFKWVMNDGRIGDRDLSQANGFSTGAFSSLGLSWNRYDDSKHSILLRFSYNDVLNTKGDVRQSLNRHFLTRQIAGFYTIRKNLTENIHYYYGAGFLGSSKEQYAVLTSPLFLYAGLRLSL